MNNLISQLVSVLPVQVRSTLNKRFISNEDMLILPSLRSSDISYPIFLKEITKFFEDRGVSEIDESGLYIGPPITPSYTGNLTMPGIVRHPLNFGKTDKEITITPLLSDVMDKVIKLFFSEYTGKPGKIVRYSNSGFPFFTNDLQLKKEHLKFVANNQRLFEESILSNSYTSLYNQLRIMFLSFIQIRLQCDVWIDGRPKKRDVATFREVYLNREEHANTKDMFNSILASCRTRVVYALPGIINNYMSTIFEGYKDGFFHKYEETFKHRSPDSILKKISRYNHFLGVDVKSYDSSIPQNFVLEVINRMPISKFEKKVIIDLFLCPIFCSDIDGNGSKGISGSPFKEFNTWKGMPSGVFFTTFINNMMMSIVYLYNFIEKSLLPREVLNDLPSFFLHKMDVGLLLAGDDGIVCCSDESKYKAILDGGLTNDILNIEKEEGIRFLGNVFYRDNQKNIKTCHDLASYVQHTYCPEKGAYSFYRKYPVLGLNIKRTEVFIDHPLWSDFKDHEEKAWRDVLGRDVNSIIRENLPLELSRMSAENNSFTNLTNAERDVLMDFSKAFYKYNDSDIRSEILDLHSQRIDNYIHEDILNFIKERRHSEF